MSLMPSSAFSDADCGMSAINCNDVSCFQSLQHKQSTSSKRLAKHTE